MLRVLHIEAFPEDPSRPAGQLCAKLENISLHRSHFALDNGESAFEAPWDAVLVDDEIPPGRLRQILAGMRARGRQTPVILITGGLGEEEVSELVREGVSDFVFKGSPTHLRLALERVVRRVDIPGHSPEAAFRLDKAVLDCIGVAIYLVRADKPEIIYTNPKLDALFGYAPGELLGEHVSVLNAPAPGDGREYHGLVISALRESGEWSGEVLSRRRDGSPFWCFMTASVLEHPAHGKFWLGARQDITDLKQAQTALHESRARFQAVFEQAAVGIARVALDGRWLEANDKFCSIVGYGRDELLELRFQDITYPPDLEADLELARRLLAGPLPNYALEKRYVCKDGSLVWVDLTASLVRQPNGEPDYFVAVVVKIQRRKEAEAALEAARQSHLQHLEQQVAERTAALQEAHDHLEERVAERTEQLRRLAAEVTFAEERERQALARDLHDDLGQLLHVVKIKLGLLDKVDMPAGGRSLVGEASGLISDASRLVRSLTSQLSPPVLSTLGLPAALQWLSSEIQQTYGLPIACRTDAGRCGLSSAQAAILFRAARELLINAAKHSGSLGASLELMQGEGELTMAVADSGRGIPAPEEVLAGNKGFGLASVRERISFLGGTMEIQSPPGGGVRIGIRLPLEAGMECAEPRQ